MAIEITGMHSAARAGPGRMVRLSSIAAFFMLMPGLLSDSAVPSPSTRRPQTPSACEDVTRDQIAERLKVIGARRPSSQSVPSQFLPAGSQTEEFELGEGVILDLTYYDDGYLAEADVHLSKDYPANVTANECARLNPPNMEQCLARSPVCMSSSSYDELLKHVGQLESLGDFLSSGIFVVSGPRGVSHLTDEFACAQVRRAERDCKNPDGHNRCEVISFSVFYDLPLKGVVESKYVRAVDSHATPGLPRYFITIAGKEVRVSETDYDRLSKGQMVQAERKIGNSYWSIVEVKDF